MKHNQYTIGVDFGTDSVRALVVDTQTGNCEAAAVSTYKRWQSGQFCQPNLSQFRQHPLDYLESLEQVISKALEQVSSEIRSRIVGLSVDSTGSTPAPVDRQGTPLALLPQYADNPNAMFILWKDHMANQEAIEINQLAKEWETDFTQFSGGVYSSEWFWSKILRVLRTDPDIRRDAFSWVEHCDWISAELTGNTDPLTLRRSRCAAGHKAMWNEAFGGLPSEAFLVKLDPLLAGLRSRLYTDTYTSDQPMGTISSQWANRLGLPAHVIIGVGGFDAHMGAVGAHIKPYSFVRVMGTSTCDMLMAPNDEIGHLLIKGICGQVDGSIVPGMQGTEAGQSAYGDYYAWFRDILLEPVRELVGEKAYQVMRDKLLPYLSEKAAALPVCKDDMVALDWINGRRTPDAKHTLKAAISGLNLGTSAEQIFKAIVEATAFGSKAIVDRYRAEGVPIKEVIALGGVAIKSPFAMQTLSDVLNLPIKITSSDQACALGAAINAAVASAVYTNVQEAQKAMASDYNRIYTPREERVKIYEDLYKRYLSLGQFIEAND
ncbi:ribulokinase [Dyadobacter tibetensis]|uniref:ribulokinase n=1 Tax=Dyadobacter tibetensis TaxID=1211851 RepID=UPI000472690D|nr:ribulokinase [Dyadobacter tibetensis]